MYIESGLNYIQVGTLLDLEEYLTFRHEYIVSNGIIYERVPRGHIAVMTIKNARSKEHAKVHT